VYRPFAVPVITLRPYEGWLAGSIVQVSFINADKPKDCEPFPELGRLEDVFCGAKLNPDRFRSDFRRAMFRRWRAKLGHFCNVFGLCSLLSRAPLWLIHDDEHSACALPAARMGRTNQMLRAQSSMNGRCARRSTRPRHKPAPTRPMCSASIPISSFTSGYSRQESGTTGSTTWASAERWTNRRNVPIGRARATPRDQ